MGEGPDDPTMAADFAAETVSGRAWGEAEEPEYVEPRRRLTPGRITAAAVVASVVVIAGAAAVVTYHFRSPEPVVAEAPTLTPVPPAPQKVEIEGPAEPKRWLPKPGGRPTKETVTVQAPPPPVAAPSLTLTALDYQFLDALMKWGFTIKDRDIVLNNAAYVCKQLRDGHDLPEVSQNLSAGAGDMDVSQAHIFASEVFLNYPTCHS